MTTRPSIGQRLTALLIAAGTLAVGGLWIASVEHDATGAHRFYDTKAEWQAAVD